MMPLYVGIVFTMLKKSKKWETKDGYDGIVECISFQETPKKNKKWDAKMEYDGSFFFLFYLKCKHGYICDLTYIKPYPYLIDSYKVIFLTTVYLIKKNIDHNTVLLNLSITILCHEKKKKKIQNLAWELWSINVSQMERVT